MRITVVSMDTRGGVQPYVALARGLARRGHAVRAVGPGELASGFTDAGIEVAALDGSIEEVLRGSGGAAEKGALASIRLSMRELPARIEGWTRTALAACEGSDVVLGGVGGMVVALSVAEKLGIPFLEAHLQPIGMPTDAYPPVMLPGTPAWLGGWATRAGHHLSELAIWKPFEGAMQRARERVLGLSGRPTAHLSLPVLYAFSRHVLPVPADARRPRHVTGYWFLDAPATFVPDPRLEAFLSREGPVISVGFGSMASADPAALARTVVSATRRVGARVLLLSGWGGLAAIEGDEAGRSATRPEDRPRRSCGSRARPESALRRVRRWPVRSQATDHTPSVRRCSGSRATPVGTARATAERERRAGAEARASPPTEGRAPGCPPRLPCQHQWSVRHRHSHSPRARVPSERGPACSAGCAPHGSLPQRADRRVVERRLGSPGLTRARGRS